MKITVLTISFIITLTSLYSQTLMKITQGTGTTLSPGNTIDEISFTTEFNCGDVILYGGESYPTVKIGDYCWLAKNLNVGNRIDVAQDQTENETIEKYCYGDLPANCITYGGLYQWDEAMQYVTTEGAKGICPEGWHIATEAEFSALSDIVSGSGNSLKVMGQGVNLGVGTNTSGFSGLLGGGSYNGGFGSLSQFGYFWNSTENSSDYAVLMYLSYALNEILFPQYYLKVMGFSVRCVKD